MFARLLLHFAMLQRQDPRHVLQYCQNRLLFDYLWNAIVRTDVRARLLLLIMDARTGILF